MTLYLLHELRYNHSRVVYATEDIERLYEIVEVCYHLDREQMESFMEWLEYYSVVDDCRINVQEIETDKFVEV